MYFFLAFVYCCLVSVCLACAADVEGGNTQWLQGACYRCLLYLGDLGETPWQPRLALVWALEFSKLWREFWAQCLSIWPQGLWNLPKLSNVRSKWLISVQNCLVSNQSDQKILFTSGPTPQVASSAARMYIRASKLCDVKDKCMLAWVWVFGIDSSNSLSDHAIFGSQNGVLRGAINSNVLIWLFSCPVWTLFNCYLSPVVMPHSTFQTGYKVWTSHKIVSHLIALCGDVGIWLSIRTSDTDCSRKAPT